MIARGKIDAVHVGTPVRLDSGGRRGEGLVTAFLKHPVAGAVAVATFGLDGDTQVNRRFHGGPEKAVYGYPLSGYAGWRAEFPELAARFGAGAMGENLAVSGLDEASLHIGDLVRAGTALLQVAQIREPCATLAAVYGTPRLVRAMARSGRCGWYYRVVEPGSLAAGDGHDVIDRPNPGWPVARLAAIAAGTAGTHDALAELTTLPGLTPEWQVRAGAALAAQR